MRSSSIVRRALPALGAVALALSVNAASAQDYESPSVPQLSALIPEALVRSGQHRIVNAIEQQAAADDIGIITLEIFDKYKDALLEELG